MVITADDFAPAQTGAFSLATDHREYDETSFISKTKFLRIIKIYFSYTFGVRLTGKESG